MNLLWRTSPLRPIVLSVSLVVFGLGACQMNERPPVALGNRVRIGTDATFPPFESHDSASGLIVGFDVDLARAVFSRLGSTIEFQAVSLDALIPGLTRNEFDCILSAYTMTAERQEQVIFSQPYYETGLAVVTRAGDSTVTGVADLVGKRVGVQSGSTGERRAQRIFRAEVFSYDSIGQAFCALEEGAVHAVLNDRPTSAVYIAGGGPAQIVGGMVDREQYGAAFRKSDARLRERFDSVLAEFMATPEFDRLLGLYHLPR